jgi:ubiquinone biosynthesis protein UbiJ
VSIRLQLDVEQLKKDVERLDKKIGDIDKDALYEVINLFRGELKKLTDRVNKLEAKRG